MTVKIPADFHLDEDLAATMTRLSTFIYKHGDERSKARTMLCCIFFEAIHDDFYRVSTAAVPCALCLMPCASCPVPHALCIDPVPWARSPVPHALCVDPVH